MVREGGEEGGEGGRGMKGGNREGGRGMEESSDLPKEDGSQ